MKIECFALVDDGEAARKYVPKKLRFTLRAVDILYFKEVESIKIVRRRRDNPETGKPTYSEVAKYVLSDSLKDLDEYDGPQLLNRKYLLFPSKEVLEMLDIAEEVISRVASERVIFLTDGYGIRELAVDFGVELAEG